MNNAAGEDLGWFWRAWFLNDYRLDQAITDVKNEATGPLVTISNLNQMAMPVTLSYETVFGKKEVPSNIESSMEMRLILAQFGSQGFVCIGAD
jgi:hypothetical protein